MQLLTLHCLRKNSGKIHLILFNSIFDYCSLFSPPPIVDIVQGDCYFDNYCGIWVNFYFFSYRPNCIKSVLRCIDLLEHSFRKNLMFSGSKIWALSNLVQHKEHALWLVETKLK